MVGESVSITKGDVMIGKRKKTWVDLVREFHKATDQPAPRKLKERHKKQAVIRLNMLRSEVGELVRAEMKIDMPGVAHELADVIYVAIGTAVEYGINIDDVFRLVHKANMAKRFPDKKFHADPMSHKILKPKRWKPANVAGILKGYKAPRKGK